MLNEKELLLLESQRHFFIENNRGNASYLDWLRSKGTNFECYKEFLKTVNDEDRVNSRYHFLETFSRILIVPVTSYFFYWTLIICILHKFNLRKPVMKIIVAHYVLGVLGNVFDRMGDLLQHYYANTYVDDLRIETKCINTVSLETAYPLKFFLQRQMATIFWYTAGIFGDWYPLLRTKAVIKDSKKLLPVYITCGIFNLSKVVLIIHHWTLLPNQLYDENGVFIMEKRDNFYLYHWIIQFIIINTSVLYDIAVYLVLKKNFFPVNDFDFGFLKKFKTTSEFRILTTAFVSICLLPFAAIAIILKYYFLITQRVKHAEFSFEDIRFSIINLQYHMIFVDQILLFQSNREHSHMLSAIFNRKKKSNKKDSKQSSKKKHNDDSSSSSRKQISLSSNQYSIFSSSQNKSNHTYSQNKSNHSYSQNKSNHENEYSQNKSTHEYSQNNSIHGYSQNNSFYKYNQNDSIHEYSQNNSFYKYNQNDSIHEYSQNNSFYKYSQNESIHKSSQSDYIQSYSLNDYIQAYSQNNSIPKYRQNESIHKSSQSDYIHTSSQNNSIPKLKLSGSHDETLLSHLIKYD
ncbi:hypothetical protein BCR32DRAFT_265909 [Anaeromyces robustus]|uniref:Uncharacterized protein n=1 Tax=Anaeromyces robustus TaxID=1754192 RepID=A0A1Y1XI82_9FUNG|nr:hypothetical protein BCR32DRAFT_265909 [Anaeromyces robustus]|eukprot:ORX85076.1 hypothetical protein BCR32DRAFT_265909 [Anaeromyces robustus]